MTTYWFCFREQDGGWSYWMRCTRDEYERFKHDPFYRVDTDLIE